MADLCPSIAQVLESCGQGSVGGSEQLYMIAFKDLKAVSTATTEVYSATTNDVISAVGFVTGTTKFVRIATLKDTSGFKETITKANNTATNYINQEVTLVLQGLSSTNRIFVESVRYQPVAILVKTRSKKWFALGFSGEMELTGGESGSGIGKDDLNGYSLTFGGVSPSYAMEVDSSLIPSIIQ